MKKAETEATNTTIYCTHTRSGKRVVFIAGDLVEVRSKAKELAGKNHRGVYAIGPKHHLYGEMCKILGIAG